MEGVNEIIITRIFDMTNLQKSYLTMNFFLQEYNSA
jgi:hypothetical protein